MAQVGNSKGSRLSKSTKSKVMAAKKAGTIKAPQAQKIRQTLRAGGTTKLAVKAIGKKAVAKQDTRSIARKPTKPQSGNQPNQGPLAASNRLIKSGVTYASATNAQRKILKAGAAKRNASNK